MTILPAYAYREDTYIQFVQGGEKSMDHDASIVQVRIVNHHRL